MNKKLFIGLTAGSLVIAGLIWLGLRSQQSLESKLPSKEVFATVGAAGDAATAYAKATGGEVGTIAGTGSMIPFIRGANPGEDRMKPVAFFVTVPGATFEDIGKLGWLCIYEQPKDPQFAGKTILHLAAQHDATGWIMTGLNNAHYENWMRVTPANFKGIVAKVFEIQ